MLLDPTSLQPADRASDVLARMSHGSADGLRMAEFFASQVEIATLPMTDASAVLHALRLLRDELSAAAALHGCLAAGTGTPYGVPDTTELNTELRYQRIAAEFGAVAREHQINGVHVHVAVESDEAAIHAVNVIRPWLPALLALSANSPFWRAQDTGFDSWRAIHSRRWSSSGIPPRFTDDGDYRARIAALSGVAGVIDAGTINWMVRPSSRYPTVEVRVFDAQLDPRTTVGFAALTRGLVRSAGPELQASAEMLDAALWHAARNGISADLVDPRTCRLERAGAVVEALVEAAAPGMAERGDGDLVRGVVRDILEHGNGATRQRRALASGGVDGLRRCLEPPNG